MVTAKTSATASAGSSGSSSRRWVAKAAHDAAKATAMRTAAVADGRERPALPRDGEEQDAEERGGQQLGALRPVGPREEGAADDLVDDLGVDGDAGHADAHRGRDEIAEAECAGADEDDLARDRGGDRRPPAGRRAGPWRRR